MYVEAFSQIVGEPQKVLWYHDIHKILPDKCDNTFSRIMEITPLIDKWFWGYHMGYHFSLFQLNVDNIIVLGC